MFRIKTVGEEEARGRVESVYREIKKEMGIVPNVLKVLSLWPDALEFYAAKIKTLVFSDTRLLRSTKEMIASTVSNINQCDYCVGHHKNFMEQFGITGPVADQILTDYRSAKISEAEKQLLAYVEKMTRHAYKIVDADIEGLKKAGWTDEQILEATLVSSMFNDINRYVDALGVEPESAKLPVQ